MSTDNSLTGNSSAQRPPITVLTFVVFGALVLTFHIPLWFFPLNIIPFQSFIAEVVTRLVDISGLQVSQEGIYIYFNNQQWWEVTQECTAISALIVFTSFVLVYPSSLKSKGTAILVGVPFLIVANILRLFTLAWATELFSRYAHLVHDYVWQVAFLMLIAVMWLVWIETVVNCENKTSLSV